MIAGLLILGSMLGLLAFGGALALGYPILTAALVYAGTAAAVVVVISAGCAFRPRRSPGKQSTSRA